MVTHAGGSPFHGPNMRWYYLGQALRPLGVQVEIVSSSSFHKYTTPPEFDGSHAEQEIDGLTYHWLRTAGYERRGVAQVRNQLEFVARCYLSSGRLAGRAPDLVIASSPHPFVSFPAQYIARKAGARFVFEVRDLWPEVLLELGNFARWHPYVLALGVAERFGVKYAERVISVKPGDGDYFNRKYGLPKSGFSYVPNGFLPDEAVMSPLPEVKQLRDRYKFIIGYVGALSIYYGLDHLLELACCYRDQKDVGFVVVGKGDLSEKLKSKALKLGLDNFHLLGSISRTSVPSTLAQFDACYVGLQDVGVHRFGISCNKIYEYMQARKPIIGSYRAGYDPVVAANCGFVAPPGDYSALTKGIDLLINQPELAIELGERGQSYFHSHHDFRVVAKTLKNALFPETAGERDEGVI